jgi:hypothetical protein
MDGPRKRIRCYPSKISEWYAALSRQERADTDEFIKDMRGSRDWKLPYYRARLRGTDGLGELRWRSEKKQHRLIGFLSRDVFYALIGCIHKQQVYKPPDALETAEKRKKQVERGEVNTVEYDL